jgi:hypothetical protein
MADDEVEPTVIVSITAIGESEDAMSIRLDVRFSNAPETRRFGHALRLLIMHALQVTTSGGGSDGGVRVDVPRAGLEEGLRAIKRTVAEYNRAYPSLLAEHEREAERLAAEKAAQRERLRADQEVIDRVLSEQVRVLSAPVDPPVTLVAGIDGCKGGWPSLACN